MHSVHQNLVARTVEAVELPYCFLLTKESGYAKWGIPDCQEILKNLNSSRGALIQVLKTLQ